MTDHRTNAADATNARNVATPPDARPISPTLYAPRSDTRQSAVKAQYLHV